MSNTDIIKRMTDTNVPVLFWGAPGTGKTAAITEVARQEGVHLEVLIGSTIDPTDLGRPVVRDDGNVWLAPPAWVRRIQEAQKNGKDTWLFLDELTSAPPAVQAALLRVVQERKVADCDIANCRILAAANPAEHAVDSTDLSHATANRWAHFQWETEASEWCSGELGGWGKPEKELSSLRGLVTSWITKSPSALLDPPGEAAEFIKGWPSPRSWSNLITACRTLEDLKTPMGRQIATALIGTGAAAEFISWTMDVDLPDPVALLNGAKTLPARGDKSVLCMNMTISHVVTHPEKVNLFWALCRKQREDLALQSAKKAMHSFETAKVQTTMTDDMEYLTDIVRKFNE